MIEEARKYFLKEIYFGHINQLRVIILAVLFNPLLTARQLTDFKEPIKCGVLTESQIKLGIGKN